MKRDVRRRAGTGNQAQDELAEQLAETEARHRTAQEVIDGYDHPLRRRMHRDELRAAHVTTRQTGFAVEGQTRELAETETKLPGLQSSVAEAQETLLGRPTLERERHGIKRQLGRDRDARKDGLAADPLDYIEGSRWRRVP